MSINPKQKRKSETRQRKERLPTIANDATKTFVISLLQYCSFSSLFAHFLNYITMTFKRGTSGHLDFSENINEFLFNDIFTDIALETNDNRKLSAHQVVLSSYSELLKEMLLNLPAPPDGSKVVLMLPGFDSKTASMALQLMYTGSLFFKDEADKEKVFELLKLLGAADTFAKGLAQTSMPEKRMKKFQEIFKLDLSEFPRKKNLPFRVHQEKKAQDGKWTAESLPDNPSSAPPSDDEDIDVIFTTDVLTRLRNSHPSLYIGPQGEEEENPTGDDCVCPMCPSTGALSQKFSSSADLVKHFHESHGDKRAGPQVDAERKPWACHECHSAFKLKIAFDNHKCEVARRNRRRKGNVNASSDCSVVMIDVEKAAPVRDDLGKKSGKKANARSSAKTATPGSRSRKRTLESEDEDVDDPDAVLSGDESDARSEMSSKSKRSRKESDDKAYASKVWSDDGSDSEDDVKAKPTKKPTSGTPKSRNTKKKTPSSSSAASTPAPKSATKASNKPSTPASSSASNVRVCIVCQGKTKKGFNNGKSIDFKNKFMESCFHYAICYYDTNRYLDIVPPGEDNLDENGDVKDAMGRESLYTCPTCVPKKPCGYKAYFVHQVAVHGELETLLQMDIDRPGARAVLDAYLTARASDEVAEVVDLQPSNRDLMSEERPQPIRCRMSRCNFSCPKKEVEKMKDHYAKAHFKAHFMEPQSANKGPRIPEDIPLGGLRCDLCASAKGGSGPVYVKGTREDVFLHYAVAHNKLRSAMKKKAAEREVMLAIGDLWTAEEAKVAADKK